MIKEECDLDVNILNAKVKVWSSRRTFIPLSMISLLLTAVNGLVYPPILLFLIFDMIGSLGVVRFNKCLSLFYYFSLGLKIVTFPLFLLHSEKNITMLPIVLDIVVGIWMLYLLLRYYIKLWKLKEEDISDLSIGWRPTENYFVIV